MVQPPRRRYPGVQCGAVGWDGGTSIAEPTNADRRPGRRGFCAAPTWSIS
jgi:hypothetical protein